MAIKVHTTAVCDVTGKEVPGTRLLRVRVTPLHALKVAAGGTKVEGDFPPLNDLLEVHRVCIKGDGTQGEWEDVAYDVLKDEVDVYLCLVPKGGTVEIHPAKKK